MDKKRDLVYRNLRAAVIRAVTHYDPVKSEAASRLQLLFTTYGYIPKKTYAYGSGSYYNFIQEARNTYMQEFIDLGLSADIDELENNTNSFNSLVTQRDDEILLKTKLTVVGVRKDFGVVYQKVLKRVEAAVELLPTPTLLNFVDKVNIIIKRYQNMIAQRKGIREANKKKKEQEKQEQQNQQNETN